MPKFFKKIFFFRKGLKPVEWLFIALIIYIMTPFVLPADWVQKLSWLHIEFISGKVSKEAGLGVISFFLFYVVILIILVNFVALAVVKIVYKKFFYQIVVISFVYVLIACMSWRVTSLIESNSYKKEVEINRELGSQMVLDISDCYRQRSGGKALISCNVSFSNMPITTREIDKDSSKQIEIAFKSKDDEDYLGYAFIYIEEEGFIKNIDTEFEKFLLEGNPEDLYIAWFTYHQGLSKYTSGDLEMYLKEYF